jgi:hypothetical protein
VASHTDMLFLLPRHCSLPALRKESGGIDRAALDEVMRNVPAVSCTDGRTITVLFVRDDLSTRMRGEGLGSAMVRHPLF